MSKDGQTHRRTDRQRGGYAKNTSSYLKIFYSYSPVEITICEIYCGYITFLRKSVTNKSAEKNNSLVKTSESKYIF